MPRRVVVVVVCSKCGAEWNEGQAPDGALDNLRLGVDDAQRQLDLCPACSKLFYDEVLEAWFSRGDEASPAKRKKASGRKVIPSGDFPCPDPSCGRSFTTAQGASMHTYRAHKE